MQTDRNLGYNTFYEVLITLTINQQYKQERDFQFIYKIRENTGQQKLKI